LLGERRELLDSLHRRQLLLADQIVPFCAALQLRVPSGAALFDEATLEKLCTRLSVIVSSLGPAFAQLEERPSPTLLDRSDAEIAELNSTLWQRVQACADVLQGYDRIGQKPPPDFRKWSLEVLEERRDNLTAKAPLLRKLLLLQAKLGQPRADWDLPACDEETLEARIAALEPQVREAEEKRVHAQLLGKAEAAFWARREDPPFGLGAKSIEELEELLVVLNKGS